MERNLVDPVELAPHIGWRSQPNAPPTDSAVIDTDAVQLAQFEVTHYAPGEFRNRRRAKDEWLSSSGIKILLALFCVTIVFVITFLLLVKKERDESHKIILDD